MRKTILSLLAIGMIAVCSNDLNAQASATASSTAVIITPIQISKTTDMNFGNVAVTGTGGTVVLAAAGTRTKTGGVTLPTTTGTVSQAVFGVQGQGTYTFSIDLPDSIVLNDGGANNMTVNAFTSNGVAGSGDTTAALVAGAFTLNVGATLNVAASQPAGTYTNTTDLTVTVNYN